MDVLVSLVGAGPGDPSLLTLAAVRSLQRADVVLYDALVHPAVLLHARRGASLEFVGKRGGHEGPTQGEINARLVALARQGLRVCRLKGGDPFLFGRGSEEAEALALAGVAFDVVPGVTAALGAAAYAGISLTHRALASSVALVTSTEHAAKSESAHDWSKLATATQTLVLYMGARKLRGELERMVAHGRSADCPAAAIQWGTRGEQRVVSATVGTLADACSAAALGAPALVVVGAVAARAGAGAGSWWESFPLAGRRVLVCRSAEQLTSTVDALLARRADPWPVALFECAPPEDPGPLARCVLRLSSYAVVVCTSANAVDGLFSALAAADLDARALAGPRLVAVGPATAERLAQRGLRADAVADEFRSEGAADKALALVPRPQRAGARALVLSGAGARGALPAALREGGLEVELVTSHRMASLANAPVGALREALEAGSIDAALLTSGAATRQLVEALGPAHRALLAPVLLASIGPVTTEAARALGLEVAVEAPSATVPALLDALEAHYETRRRGG